MTELSSRKQRNSVSADEFFIFFSKKKMAPLKNTAHLKTIAPQLYCASFLKMRIFEKCASLKALASA